MIVIYILNTFVGTKLGDNTKPIQNIDPELFTDPDFINSFGNGTITVSDLLKGILSEAEDIGISEAIQIFVNFLKYNLDNSIESINLSSTSLFGKIINSTFDLIKFK